MGPGVVGSAGCGAVAALRQGLGAFDRFSACRQISQVWKPFADSILRQTFYWPEATSEIGNSFLCRILLFCRLGLGRAGG